MQEDGARRARKHSGARRPGAIGGPAILAAWVFLGTSAPSHAAAQSGAPNPQSLAPQTQLPPPLKLQFTADPIADGAVLSLALGVAVMSEAILSTGEISPQKPNSEAKFIGIDEASIGKVPIAGWGSVSNIGLVSALVFAALDPVQTGFRDSPQAGLVDGIIYAETLSTIWALTNVTKIAFRRPRPEAYAEQARLDEACADQGPECVPQTIDQTDSALSFFSGHAAITAAVFSTGTYLAFARSPKGVRPWLVLAAGATITTLVDIGRVQAGKHFPTDVIAGSLAGIGVGVLVPHLHRTDSLTRRPMWIGFEPRAGGGAITLNGLAL